MTETKEFLHPDNKHRELYDLKALIKKNPMLKNHLKESPTGAQTIDFASPNAVKELNKAILFDTYNLTYWDIPENYLVPPIPSRADYLHRVNDLLPKKSDVRVLDIGTGANCIYPILGSQLFGWEFVGTDVSKTALESARTIVQQNKVLTDKIKFRLNKNPKKTFENLINKNEYFDLTVCNPPFHSSRQEAVKANRRKNNNLNLSNQEKRKLNFGGQNNELWYEGGEVRFISQMIMESKRYAKNVGLFTTLVSKKESLKPIEALLKKQHPKRMKIIEMNTGNKQTRILCWGF